MATVASSAVSDAVTQLQSHAAEWLKSARSFSFGLRLDHLLDHDGVVSGSERLDGDVLASWTLLFLALYVAFAAAWRLLPRTGLQSGKLPFIAASRCIGIVHCTVVVPLAVTALCRQSRDWRLLEYLGVNSALEQRITELSVGYFMADFVHFILFEPDMLMFFHHVFSIAMMGSAGVYGRGATAGMAALVQGEITNPLQSTWTIAKTAKASRALAWLSPLFTYVFVLVRVPIVPLWTLAYINPNLLWGPNKDAPGMPRALVLSWSAMSVLMTAGGWAWSWMLIKGLRKFYRKQQQVAHAQPQQQAKKMQ